MRKKRILFIIWSFSYGGGAEKVLATLANKMDLDKYEIDILEYWHADIKNEEVNPKINVLPPVIDSTKDNKVKMLITKILLEHFPKVLRKKFIKKEYDYEIAFNYLIPTFLLKKTGQTISWIHTDVYDLKENKYQYKLQKKAFKYISKIVAISDNTYKSLLEMFPEYKDKVTIINNSFDFKDIEEKAKEKVKIKKNKFTFLFAGRLDERKNPLFLIETAKILKEMTDKFEIWMIGQGNLQDEVEKKIKEYDLKNNVKLLGFQKNPYPYFQKCDAVVLTSLAEGFPTVLAEGLSLGKPFISTNSGGVSELSKNNTCGCICQNEKEFANKMNKFITDPKYYQKMSQMGKKHILNFTPEKQIEKIENLLKEISNKE